MFCVPTGEVGRFFGALKRQNLALTCLEELRPTFERRAEVRATARGTRRLPQRLWIDRKVYFARTRARLLRSTQSPAWRVSSGATASSGRKATHFRGLEQTSCPLPKPTSFHMAAGLSRRCNSLGFLASLDPTILSRLPEKLAHECKRGVVVLAHLIRDGSFSRLTSVA